MVIGFLAGAGYGIARSPVYSAQAQLYVGKTESLSNTAAIPGLAAAATQVAGDYARLITSSTAIVDAESRLHVKSLPGSLSASQIANSPEIVVYSSAHSRGEAIRLADAGSAALITAVNQLNNLSQQQLTSLRNQYVAIQQSIATAQAKQVQLNTQLSELVAQSASQSEISDVQSQLTDLASTIASDQLEATALENQYQSNYAPVQSDEQSIASLGPARSTGSDRVTKLGIGLVAGTAIGLFVGATVAAGWDIRGEEWFVRRRRTGADPQTP